MRHMTTAKATYPHGDIRRPTFADATIDYVGFLAGIVWRRLLMHDGDICRPTFADATNAIRSTIGKCRHKIPTRNLHTQLSRRQMSVGECRHQRSRRRYATVVRLHSQLSHRQKSVGECRPMWADVGIFPCWCNQLSHPLKSYRHSSKSADVHRQMSRRQSARRQKDRHRWETRANKNFQFDPSCSPCCA